MHKGEDVVAGIRTPQPIEQLKETNPKAYEDFVMYSQKIRKTLQRYARYGIYN